MLKSWTDDEKKSEFPKIKRPDHIEKVWAAIKENLPTYFGELTAAPPDPTEVLGQKFRINRPSRPKAPPALNMTKFEAALLEFEKEAAKYEGLFTASALESVRESDPDAFKTLLSRRCPVIHSSLNSPTEDLKEWKIKFKMTPSEELLATFENLIAFADDYVDSYGSEDDYSSYDAREDFHFEGYDVEEVGILGVIGGGIKSQVLYRLHPSIFPARSGPALCGLYFLSGKQSFGLPSKSSEFLMIDDERVRARITVGSKYNDRMDHNYWYPYDVFTLYAMRIWRELQRMASARSVELDNDFRYVYVDRLLSFVCSKFPEDMNVIRGGDEGDRKVRVGR